VEPPASAAEMEPPASEAEVEPPASEAEVEPPASEAEAEPPASEAEVEPPASALVLEADADMPAAVKVEGEDVSALGAEQLVLQDMEVDSASPGSSPKRRRESHGAGAVSADKPAVPPVKLEDVGYDYATVSFKQGLQLREKLGEAETPISFFETIEADQSSAEAAACRFVDLLALHMKGAVSLEQDSPFADIIVGRGSDWNAWCEDASRGVKRESRDADSALG